MTIAAETLAEIVLGEVGVLGANDAARSSFTAWAGDCLIAGDMIVDALSGPQQMSLW